MRPVVVGKLLSQLVQRAGDPASITIGTTRWRSRHWNTVANSSCSQRQQKLWCHTRSGSAKNSGRSGSSTNTRTSSNNSSGVGIPTKTMMMMEKTPLPKFGIEVRGIKLSSTEDIDEAIIEEIKEDVVR